MTDAEVEGAARRGPHATGPRSRSDGVRPTLRTLSRLYGAQPAWKGPEDRVRTASETALVRALQALGAPLETAADAPDALRACRRELERRLLDPATVLWRDADAAPEAGEERRPPAVPVRIPGGRGTTLRCRLETEEGAVEEWETTLGEGAPLPLPTPLPDGVHRLRVRTDQADGEQWVIRAPRTAFPGRGQAGRSVRPEAARPGPDGPSGGAGREWGLFLPLYALRTGRSGGSADLADLRDLAEWTAGLGGRVVGTLPLLAAHLGDGPFDPSPYAPVSRLFWNELFLDVEGAPELDEAPEARRLLESSELREAAQRLRQADRVDYEAAARWKHRVLQPLADAVVGDEPRRRPGLRAWLDGRPEAEAYARFRAVGARQGRGWREWPEPLRSAGSTPGRIPDDAMDARAFRLHLYAQWLADRQMARLSEPGAAGLHLDLPLGTHPDGFDTWRWPSLFAEGVSGGAPPDAFFEGGQDWGFPPLHPAALRTGGYAYWRAALRTQLRNADLLRVDHVMGLHRLFWVPRGLGAAEGVYVHYPAEELWALLCLESRRHGTEIVGEDLGTVPGEVRRAMDRHGVRKMYVVPFEIRDGGQEDVLDALAPVPPNALATLGTHDLPPFAAFWRDRTAEPGASAAAPAARGDAPEVGAPAPAPVGDDADALPPDTRPALRRVLSHLAASPARWLLVSLEDLWLETEPQNVPGPDPEGGSWRRKASLGFEEFRDRPDVVEVLEDVDRLRRHPTPTAPPRADSHETTVSAEGQEYP